MRFKTTRSWPQVLIRINHPEIRSIKKHTSLYKKHGFFALKWGAGLFTVGSKKSYQFKVPRTTQDECEVIYKNGEGFAPSMVSRAFSMMIFFDADGIFSGLPTGSLTVRPWKWMVGRLLTFGEGNFSGAMLNFWGVKGFFLEDMGIPGFV